MGRPRNVNAGMVIAKEAIVIVVGSEPPKFERVTVADRRTGALVEINKDEPYEQGKDGIPYVFKPYQRVPRDHPAVKACPSGFVEVEDLTDAEQELIAS